MPAPLSLRIKEQYMAKRARGLSQQIAADAVGISVRSAQRIERGELQVQGQQQQGRRWRTRADPLAEVWDSVLVPMLEKAPQLEPQTLLLHLEQVFPDQEWYRRKRTLQRRVEQWRAPIWACPRCDVPADAPARCAGDLRFHGAQGPAHHDRWCGA